MGGGAQNQRGRGLFDQRGRGMKDRTGPDEECEQGVKKPRKAEPRNRQSRKRKVEMYRGTRAKAKARLK